MFFTTGLTPRQAQAFERAQARKGAVVPAQGARVFATKREALIAKKNAAGDRRFMPVVERERKRS